MKKLFAIICVLMMIMVAGAIIPTGTSSVFLSCAYAEELDVATNLHWKSGSTATAKWDAVANADYYYVKVLVYNNSILLGSAETGTSQTEIDIQAEIQELMGSYRTVSVAFAVCPVYSVGENEYRGTYSAQSSKTTYSLQGTIKLSTPQNVTIGADYTASWSPVANKDYYRVFIQIAYNGKTINTTEIASSTRMNIKEAVKAYIKSSEFSGKTVQVSIKVCAVAYLDNPDYLTGDYSANSNTVEFTDDGVAKLGIPTNVTLNDNLYASWSPVPNRDYYRVYISMSCNGSTLSTTEISSSTTFNVADAVNAYLKSTQFAGKTVQVSIKVCAVAYLDNPNYLTGDYSAFTEAHAFKHQVATKLSIPQNVNLNNDLWATWSSVTNCDYYRICISMKCGNQIKYTTEISSSTSFNVKNAVKAYLKSTTFVGKAVEVTIQVCAVAYLDNPQYITSDYSAMTDVVMYYDGIAVDNITLAPSYPILYIGNSLYLGKTITPENAYYTSINWSTSDLTTVPVSTSGRITGTRVGTATITAAIGDVSDSVEVTVYDISSNIEDPNEQNQVTDTAGGIIDDIVNTDDPDLGNTDIDAGDLPEIREDIQEGIWRGDEFFTDVVWYEENFGKYKENWGQIQKAAQKLNAEFAGAYNVEVEMYHKDDAGTDYHIGNITELPDEITFTFDLPTGMKEQQAGYARKYVLVRIHKNNIEAIDAVVNEDGTVTTKSDCFSDFILLYVDEKMDAIDLSGYTAMNLPAATTTIAAEAFEGIAAEVVFIPENCSSIGYHAFANCPNLVYVVVTPGSDVMIDDAALDGTKAQIIYQ